VLRPTLAAGSRLTGTGAHQTRGSAAAPDRGSFTMRADPLAGPCAVEPCPAVEARPLKRHQRMPVGIGRVRKTASGLGRARHVRGAQQAATCISSCRSWSRSFIKGGFDQVRFHLRHLNERASRECLARGRSEKLNAAAPGWRWHPGGRVLGPSPPGSRTGSPLARMLAGSVHGLRLGSGATRAEFVELSAAGRSGPRAVSSSPAILSNIVYVLKLQ
jgi:hypothetical protein